LKVLILASLTILLFTFCSARDSALAIALSESLCERIGKWFEEHEGKLQHFSLPAQPPDSNITEILWSVSETIVRNRFSASISLTQLEVIIQE
jgi:hypothetical protein